MDQFQNRYSVDCNRLTLSYRVHGDSDGLPMLLLHGNFGSSRWWAPFVDILPDDIYAVAPDLRGCGGSTKSTDGYAIREQARDVAEFIEALDLYDFDLVGHSSGGAIAVEYALGHSERMRSLVLLDSAPVEGVFTPLEGLRLMEQMRTDRDLLARAFKTLMPTAPPASMKADQYELFFQQLLNDAQNMAPSAFTGVAEALNRWNRFEEAGSLSLPTLLVWGDQDTIVDRDAMMRTLLAIPGANNLEVLRGVGHSPMVESPVVLAERLIEFISEDFIGFADVRTFAEEQSNEKNQNDTHE